MDEKAMICCPMCRGEGKVDPLSVPLIEKAIDVIAIPLLEEAVQRVITHRLLKDAKEPPNLVRKYIITTEDLAKQKRVYDFAQVAGVLRHISSAGSDFKLQGTLIIFDGRAMIITVLFVTQAAAAEGIALFGHPLKPYVEDAKNDSA